MSNNKLIALLLVATIDIPWAESAHNHDLYLKRDRREIDEKPKWANFGSVNRNYQNNYYFNSEGGRDNNPKNPSVGTGSVTNQDQNSYTNVGQVTNVYVVMPYWYNVSNQQTPAAVHRSLGTTISQERYRKVLERINQLEICVKIIRDEITAIESTNHVVDRIAEKPSEEYLTNSSKLNILFHKCNSLQARVNYQRSRLNHFKDDTLSQHDIFDGDLDHLKLIIESTVFDVVPLRGIWKT